VSQSNSRFNALDTLVVTVHSVKMPGGFGKRARKTMGRSFSAMARLKKSIVEVKTEENCLAHALVIAIAKVENDLNYKAYRQGWKIRNIVLTLLHETGIDLSSGGGIPELTRFQEHFRRYKIVVYHGLSCDDIMFQGRVDSSKRLNLLYDDVERHYQVIVNLTAAMAKTYVCKGWNKACTSDVTHVCDQTCSDCAAYPPCAVAEVRIPCDDCHRHFRSPTCFANHKQSTSTQKSVCERKRRCEKCGGWQVATSAKHECFKRFCSKCKENKDIGHLCYMRPLKDTLPAASDKVLYVFYDIETTQNTEYEDESKLHVPNLVTAQQFCSRCEDAEVGDCALCGRRKHTYRQDPVGELLIYLRETEGVCLRQSAGARIVLSG